MQPTPKQKKGKRFMQWILGTIAVVAVGAIIWFSIPYSPTRSEFKQMTTDQIARSSVNKANDVFTEEDIAHLPEPVKRYFCYTGYIGKPRMINMKAYYNDVDFVLSGKKIKIKYTQYNFADEPVRIAYIDTRMFGIPFEGLDAYYKGEGFMKGVLAKGITLFDQGGPSMDKSSLVTCLAEALLIPNLALQDFVSWQEIDDTHARATMEYYGISVSGVFEFGENGEMIRFTTDDREYADPSGKTQMVRWSAVMGDYRESGGIKHPTSLKGVWHFETGDLVYFDGRDIVVEYDVGE
jgi:hypothetical protein